MPSELPDHVQALLKERLESFEQLKILLLLREQQDHTWTADAVGKALSLSPMVASRALDHLCRGGLLDVRVGNDALVFRYSPVTPPLDAAVAELARVGRGDELIGEWRQKG